MAHEALEEHKKKHSAALAPFIVEFTLAILLGLQGKEFIRPQKHVIHSDMVPKVSSHVMQARMREQMIIPRRHPHPISLPQNLHPVHAFKPVPVQQPKPQPKPVITPTNINVERAWEKIMPLLNDESVTHIECSGPNKPLMVSRHGRRQTTRIILYEPEIKKILETMAEQAHVPLLEGVFRVILDTYSVNAVVSEMIGSKFVIKKNTPYSMMQ